MGAFLEEFADIKCFDVIYVKTAVSNNADIEICGTSLIRTPVYSVLNREVSLIQRLLRM